jgi:uncharacterized membrane protein
MTAFEGLESHQRYRQSQTDTYLTEESAVESHYRSIVKAITWRTGGTIVTFAVAWFVTGSIHFSAKIGVLDTIVKIGVFYFHERLWNRLNFGRPKPPEYQI